MKFKRIEYGCVAILLIVSYQCVGFCQQQEQNIHDDIRALKSGQNAIMEELKSIRAIMQSMKPSPNIPSNVNVRGVEFEINSDAISGSNSASIVLIEFADYQCKFCSKYVRETYPVIRSQYIESEKIRYAVMNNPLPTHKHAQKAAEASYCALDQGKFWDFHSHAMTKQELLDDLSMVSSDIGLNVSQFEECLKTNKYRQQVNNEIIVAKALGIPGVPAFILAEFVSSNPAKVRGLSFIFGAQPFDNYKKEIDSALAILATHEKPTEGQGHINSKR